MILAIGPYIGNFEQEILTFRPYTRWLWEIWGNEYDKLYVNTHFNRMFLYDFLPKENLIPVFENLTRDELNQKGYIHRSIKPKDYQILVKNMKDIIMDKENCGKKDIQVDGVGYIKSTPPIPIHRKKFTKIECDIENEFKDHIVFIPLNRDNRDRLAGVKQHLKDIDKDTIIIGSKKTRFRDENVVLNRVDYTENGYKVMVKIVSEARAVFCPISHWTTICNLQGAPVFSWGEQPGQHKPGGIYNFGNKNCLALPISPISVMREMIDYFLEGVENENS